MRHALRRTSTLLAGGLLAAACLLPNLEVDDSSGGRGGASGEGGAAAASSGGTVFGGTGGSSDGGTTSSSGNTAGSGTSSSGNAAGQGGAITAGGAPPAGGAEGIGGSGGTAGDGGRVCGLGTVSCGADECVDLDFDEDHCGDCDTQCDSTEACLSAMCCSEAPLAGGACNLDGCGCASDEICYPDQPETGLQCFETDNLGENADCRSGVCARGLGCFSGTCKPYCESGADCQQIDGVAECLPTFWSSNGDQIPGVSVCPRVCDAAYPQDPLAPLRDCPDNFGCLPDPGGASDCFYQPGIGIPGAACSSDAQCSPGRFCDAVDGYCRDFCLSNDDCNFSTGDSSTCIFALGSQPLYAGSYEVGYCTLCTNSVATCLFVNDGECDDGGDGSIGSSCTFGTDCADCGPR